MSEFETVINVCANNTSESATPVTTATTNSTNNERQSSGQFKCPEKFGYYPDQNECAKYYVCVFGDALHESCTGGLYFSAELQTCDWPRNVECAHDLYDDRDKYSVDHIQEGMSKAMTVYQYIWKTISCGLTFNLLYKLDLNLAKESDRHFKSIVVNDRDEQVVSDLDITTLCLDSSQLHKVVAHLSRLSK